MGKLTTWHINMFSPTGFLKVRFTTNELDGWFRAPSVAWLFVLALAFATPAWAGTEHGADVPLGYVVVALEGPGASNLAPDTRVDVTSVWSYGESIQTSIVARNAKLLSFSTDPPTASVLVTKAEAEVIATSQKAEFSAFELSPSCSSVSKSPSAEKKLCSWIIEEIPRKRIAKLCREGKEWIEQK